MATVPTVPKPEVKVEKPKLVIPFISDDKLVTGLEERITLFAVIAAKGLAVSKDWLCKELNIAPASLASLTSRYNYAQKTVKTSDGITAIKLSVKPIKKSSN